MEDFIRAFVAHVFGDSHTGPITLKKTRFKIKPRVKRGDEVVDIKLKVVVEFDGDVGGEPLTGKWKLKYRGSENLSTAEADTTGAQDRSHHPQNRQSHPG